MIGKDFDRPKYLETLGLGIYGNQVPLAKITEVRGGRAYKKIANLISCDIRPVWDIRDGDKKKRKNN